MYQTLYILRKRGMTESTVVNLGQTFAIGSKKYDILRLAAEYIELKNVDFVTYPLKDKPQVIAQVIDGYFANISSLDKFDWIAHYKKLRAKSIEVYGVEWTQSDALQNMKNQFQEMFQTAISNSANPNPNLPLPPGSTYGDWAFKAIWSNPNGLRGNLFENPEILKQDAQLEFNSWIQTQDDEFSSFIKVE